MSVNFTFSDKDLIRFYENNLEPEEQFAVDQYFKAQLGPDPNVKNLINAATTLVYVWETQETGDDTLFLVNTLRIAAEDVDSFWDDVSGDEIRTAVRDLRDIIRGIISSDAAEILSRMPPTLWDNVKRYLPQPLRTYATVLGVIPLLRQAEEVLDFVYSASWMIAQSHLFARDLWRLQQRLVAANTLIRQIQREVEK